MKTNHFHRKQPPEGFSKIYLTRREHRLIFDRWPISWQYRYRYYIGPKGLLVRRFFTFPRKAMGFVSLPADALRSGYPELAGSLVECMRQGVRGNCLEYFFEPGEAEYLEFMSYLFHRKDIAI